MKQILIVCYIVFVALTGRAQTSSWTDATGAKFDFKITDPINKYAKITSGNSVSGATVVTVPGIVPYNGDTYKVTEVAGLVTGVNSHYYFNGLKKIILSENIKVIQSYSVNIAFDVEDVVFPSTLEVIQFQGCSHLNSLKGVDLSHTNVRYIGEAAFNSNLSSISYIKLPQTLRRIDFGMMGQANPPLKFLELPERVDTLSYGTFNGLYALEELSFTKPTPALLYTSNPINPSYGPYSPFTDLTNLRAIYVPIDATAAYEAEAYWSDGTDKYRERLPIGPSGYTTFYLDNENFKVPDGCTAYIITGVTPSGSITTPDNAIVKAFSAGKIIPKQTGFILQGTPNSTVVYQANVTGIEEDVTGNLLVGTATEREISGASYKYYVLSNSGDQGLGFYKQGTRGGASIKLKAHRAGLRLTESIARAKSFFIDFDAARENANVAGIRNIGQEAEGRDNVIYDLQGRRVKNPTHGIYIINGKKVIK